MLHLNAPIKGTYVLSCGSGAILQLLYDSIFGSQTFIHRKLGIQAPLFFRNDEAWRPRGLQTKGEHLLLVGVEGNFADCFCLCTWTAKLNGLSPEVAMWQIERGIDLARLEEAKKIFGMPEYLPGSTAAAPLPPDPLYKHIVDPNWRPAVFDSLLERQ